MEQRDISRFVPSIRRLLCGASLLSLTLAGPALAGEGGGSHDPTGAESFFAGFTPPQGGGYLVSHLNWYSASRLNDGNGDRNRAVKKFDLDATAYIARFGYIFNDVKVLGGNLGTQAIVPLVNLTVSVNGMKDSDFGFGDIMLDPVYLTWHLGALNMVLAPELTVPTGSYKRTALANVGRNYTSLSGVFSVTYLAGPVDLSIKARYNHNYTNKDGAFSGINPTGADYRSGDEIAADFAIGYNISQSFEIGAQGYWVKQIEDDEIKGNAAANALLKTVLDGNRGQLFAFGPGVRYAWNGIQLIGAWQHEFVAENMPQGDRFWLKAAFSF